MAEFYKIGEVSKMCNISIKTLRYYEEFGLITPVSVDRYTGYRHYNSKNVETIYKIQFLKDLGFSLKEIKDFDETQINEKIKDINEKIEKLKNSVKLMDSLNKHKGEENIMKPFINDPEAIGKWKYVCSATSKESYEKGDSFVDKDAFFQEFYFLPNGEGYWGMQRWTKGIVYDSGNAFFKYNIENNLLFMEIYDENEQFEILMVFEKENNKEYTLDEISTKDNIDMPFVLDEESLGCWEAVDFIKFKDKFNYTPKKDIDDDLFLKSLNIMANGNCFWEFTSGKTAKHQWTKNYILNIESSLASNYIIQTINNENYLIMDWKSGDYVYGKFIAGCYVFKKVK